MGLLQWFDFAEHLWTIILVIFWAYLAYRLIPAGNFPARRARLTMVGLLTVLIVAFTPLAEGILPEARDSEAVELDLEWEGVEVLRVAVPRGTVSMRGWGSDRYLIEAPAGPQVAPTVERTGAVLSLNFPEFKPGSPSRFAVDLHPPDDHFFRRIEVGVGSGDFNFYAGQTEVLEFNSPKGRLGLYGGEFDHVAFDLLIANYQIINAEHPFSFQGKVGMGGLFLNNLELSEAGGKLTVDRGMVQITPASPVSLLARAERGAVVIDPSLDPEQDEETWRAGPADAPRLEVELGSGFMSVTPGLP